jgi:acetyl/propionyl-CoA carboxylase alpha subunit
MFRKVLIANRGEIAVRVIRAVHDLGAEAIAVYSEADRGSLHVRLADYAYPIGPSPAAQSYLNAGAILDVARRSGAEAVHPGYGFLSEQAPFASACAAAGMAFVGPSPEALALMGDKVAARRLAAAAGVPTVPGTPEAVDEHGARTAAAEIGFPLLIKAAAGGGGKGMRAVSSPAELAAALAQAHSEAAAAFGDGSVYLEKLVERPRHVEVQLFGDGTGRVEHLGERECSLQRRYQKVVEEAPAPNLPDDLRRRLWSAAVAAASAARYAGAGTIEFLVAPDADRFYFLEMNARLQVEHPVTEMVTGVDLVEAQLLLAAGAPLDEALGGGSHPLAHSPTGRGGTPARTGQKPNDPHAPAAVDTDSSPSPSHQSSLQLSRHAVEARIYAEDPANSWFPSIGTIDLLREPAGPGIRVDSACEPGAEVSVYYDPLLAKLIAYGRSRDEAIARLRRALDEYVLTGVRIHHWLVRDEAFLRADLSTAFIADRWHPAASGSEAASGTVEAAALALAHDQAQRLRAAAVRPQAGSTADVASSWRVAARRAGLRS